MLSNGPVLELILSINKAILELLISVSNIFIVLCC